MPAFPQASSFGFPLITSEDNGWSAPASAFLMFGLYSFGFVEGCGSPQSCMFITHTILGIGPLCGTASEFILGAIL